jgi:glycosyltransferase involved in cell wall biosynthesis
LLRRPLNPPRRVLITLDAIGGVWRYALDVALGLEAYGVTCLLVGFGPEPDASQRAECERWELLWTDEPLDWVVANGSELDEGTRKLTALARDWQADVLHLNLPSQAAGLDKGLPVVVASHSCVPTWWQAVRGTALPEAWAWQRQRNLDGFARADAVVVPSESHAAALRLVYGGLPPLHVVYNATASAERADDHKYPLILAVGRWWDAGKNGEVLDAAESPWPILLAGPVDGPGGSAVFRNVRMVGALGHKDILTLMRRAAIFAAPSRYEPFGLAVAEAAMRGAALVLSDIPTFRELWDGAALFVGANDIDGWSRAFAALAANPELRHQLAIAAGLRVERFSPPQQAGRLYDVYSRVAASVPVT